MKCPECENYEGLRIYCAVRTKVYVDREGNVEDSIMEEGYTWDDDNEASCTECGWDGTVKQLDDADKSINE